MRNSIIIIVVAVSAVFGLLSVSWADKPGPEKALLVIQGKVLDSAGNPVSDANILPYLDKKPYVPASHGSQDEKGLSTGRNGLFMIEMEVPAE